MPRVSFTPHLQRHVACPPRDVAAATLREALEAVFADNPALRGYVLDDQNRLRKHVMVFIDQGVARDRDLLSDDVANAREIFVFQALSGG